MGILRWSLRSQGKFVGTVTAGWTTIAVVVLLGRKILTGEFGSPDFVGVMLLIPLGAIIWSIVMWKLVFESNPHNEHR
jgi:hypothetical protein